jgi:hypothetical protein
MRRLDMRRRRPRPELTDEEISKLVMGCQNCSYRVKDFMTPIGYDDPDLKKRKYHSGGGRN